MKLPNFKRLYFNDYKKEFQELVEQMSYTINTSFEGIFNTLSNNVSIRDNLLASVRDVTVIVDANGNPTATTALSVDSTNPIDGLIVIKAVNQTNGSIPPSSGIWISYTQNGSKITINNVTGLPANNIFNIRVIAFLT